MSPLLNMAFFISEIDSEVDAKNKMVSLQPSTDAGLVQ
jgi:hypothetical protein